MEGTQKCPNKLRISNDMEMELDRNVPTGELQILGELSKDLRGTIKKYSGKLLSTPEISDDSYVLFISTMVVDIRVINNNFCAVWITDAPSFVKRLISKP